MRQEKKRTTTQILFLIAFIVVAVIASSLIVLCILSAAKYGRGLGFYLMLLFPCVSIITGISALLINKWWKLVSGIWIIIVVIIFVKGNTDPHMGFILPVIIYVGLCVISGVISQNFKRLYMNKHHSR